MPTPVSHQSDSITALNLAQSACPTPLTPPTDVYEAPSPQFRDVDLPSDGRQGMFVNGNTAAGMAQVHEASLYLSPSASPPASAAGGFAQDETNLGAANDSVVLLERKHTTDGTAQMTRAISLGAKSVLHASRGSNSVPFSSSPPNGSDEHEEEDLELTDTIQTKPSRKEESSTLNRGPEPYARGDAETVHTSKMAKVDTELNWTERTVAQDFTQRRLEPKYPSSLFQSFSRYSGSQQSDKQVYNVDVTILTVDMEQNTLSGYLLIRDLTPEHATLQTYFTGEIIGGPNQKYSFRTKTPAWGASDKTDLTHWARFPAWRPLSSYAKRNVDFQYPVNGQPWWDQETIFMRWKEHFLVPDHKTSSIVGASFEGFYYICLNQSEGKISGIYFHSKSEKYQQLELKHEGESGIWHRGLTPCVEFR